MKTLSITKGIFNAVAYTPDGRYLVGVHSGWRVRVWRTADLIECFAAGLPGILYCHSAIAFLGDFVVLTHGVYDFADVWACLATKKKAPKRNKLIRTTPLSGTQGFSYDTFRTDGRQILQFSCSTTFHPPSRTGHLTFVDTNWQAGRRVSHPASYDVEPQLASDGRTLGLPSGYELLLYDIAEGKQVGELRHTAGITAFAFSPDGRRVAVAGERVLYLWDVATGKGHRFPAFAKFIEAVAFHPEGTSLAAADRAGEIRHVDLATGRANSLNFEVGAIHGLAFSPDGMTVAGAGHNDAVVVWDLE